MIIVKGPAYIRPVGDDDGECKLLGSVTGRYSLIENDDRLYEELVEFMKRPVRSVTTTIKFGPMSQLERRAYLRMFFGMESGSLIHKGKKRRKR